MCLINATSVQLGVLCENVIVGLVRFPVTREVHNVDIPMTILVVKVDQRNYIAIIILLCGQYFVGYSTCRGLFN